VLLVSKTLDIGSLTATVETREETSQYAIGSYSLW